MIENKDADLYIYVTMESNILENFLAWAAACDIDYGSFRPKAGQIHLNSYNMVGADDSYAKQEN